MTLSEPEQTALIVFCAVAGVAAVFVMAAVLWKQGREFAWQQGRLDELEREVGVLTAAQARTVELVDDVRGWAWSAHEHMFPGHAETVHKLTETPDGHPVPDTAPQARTEPLRARNEPTTQPITIPDPGGPPTVPDSYAAHTIAPIATHWDREIADFRARLDEIAGGETA